MNEKLCKLCEEPQVRVRKSQTTRLYGVAVSENDDYVNQPPRENSLFYSVSYYFRGNGIKGLKMDNKGVAIVK
ncbi:hypothetical protein LCGC14_0802550 [marine sediment metagenome]|uniref:Uncharacterized protein n=1 Tax=marine sediment metagenome TaxID=412755 RepID=A0A0F9Q927_9ZZZZ|nr:hypothetical protein [Candidatus Aminicenantes bacterium]